MEFHEKLQQLRKKYHLTQEQLAAELFVSRTAVSKWESGRGFPNLETLKTISKRFEVSIDWLLSNEELIDIAEKENNENVNKIADLVWGMLDASTLILLFLPLFGQREGDFFRGVTLFQLENFNHFLHLFYFITLSLLSLIGTAELLMIRFYNEKYPSYLRMISLCVHIVSILLFAISSQPYATAFLFLLFTMKCIIKMKHTSKP